MPALTLLRGGTSDLKETPGILMAGAHRSVELRRFLLKNLRDLGFGKTSMEEQMAEEVAEMCRLFQETNGQPVDCTLRFNLAVVNSLWKMLTNEKLKQDDEKLKAMLEKIKECMAKSESPLASIAMAYVPMYHLFEKTGLVDFRAVTHPIFEMVMDKYSEHKSTFDEAHHRDLMDVFISKMEEEKQSEDSSFNAKNGELYLKNIFFDMFHAGNDTMNNTLNWAMLYMATHPEVQKRVQKELDEVTGRARRPQWADRKSTPYVEATIHEIQRCGDVAPLAVVHVTTEEVNIGPYVLPKDTSVMPNLTSVMKDPETFPNPEEFNPDRFMKNGAFEPSPNVIPFGVGKRRCIGETFAKTSIYLFFTGLLHEFAIEKDADDQLSLEPIQGFINKPQPFKVKFIQRK